MEKTYDLIIIGGGPAGTAAGIYGARHGLDSLLITKGFGGQMARKAVDIENYPGFKKISGSELVQKFQDQLRGQKIEIKIDSAAKIEKVGQFFLITTGGKIRLRARAVIICSGADPRPLEVPGEKEFIGKGVSYCSTCDGPFFENKTVAVVGGGNAGFETAVALAKYASKIYILEFHPEVAADQANQEAVKRTGKVEIITSAALQGIRGKELVDSVLWQDRETKKINTLKVDGVFVEIGSQPATSFVKDLVEFSERDEIKIDPGTCQTKTPGLFAAGDVTDGEYKQIVIAAGEGAKAVLSAAQYLEGKN